MTNLIEYIEEIGNSYGIIDPYFTVNVSKFLVGNNWFGCQPVKNNDELLLEDSLAEKIGEKVALYCELYDVDEDGKTKYLINQIGEYMPKTATFLDKYITLILFVL